MSGIKLTWDIGSFNPEKHFIYRSASPISPSNLPTPIAEVGQGINEYNDLSITDGETYHYFVAAEKMGLLCPSDSSVGVQAINLGPGPQTLIGGDMTAGFFGETTTDELIAGDALATEIGLTAGVSQFSTEPWLKFSIDGKILFIAKKPYRHSVSWDDINAVNAVYDDANAPVVSVGGFDMKVTLMTGAEADPTAWTTSSTADDNFGAGSEWNRLMYRVHTDVPTGGTDINHGGAQVGDNWASYTNDQIATNTSAVDGSQTLTQETLISNGDVVIRGASTIQSMVSLPKNITNAYNGTGWRPVLRLQQ